MRVLVAAAVLSCASAAVAKPPPEVHTGTNTNRDTSQSMWTEGRGPASQMEVQPTDDAIAVARSMARCVVSQHSREVKAALMVGAADDFRKATKHLNESLGDCMGYGGKNLADFSNMEVSPGTLAGLLAEAMLVREGMPALVPGKYEANAPKLDWLAGSPASLVQLRLGECLSMTQPAPVSAFVASPPSSPQETAAFQGLVPAIPACLDKNVTLKATKSSLRLALAFALYRRTLQPVMAGASAQ